MMPDLPNVGWERDMESFREFFENPAFRSDGLKASLLSFLLLVAGQAFIGIFMSACLAWVCLCSSKWLLM